MKCISLWQPWASLVVLGSKRVETRSWPTKYRGRLAIHAAKRKNISELIYYKCFWSFDAAFHKLGGTMTPGCDQKLLQNLPFGSIIGSVDLVDCKRTEQFTLAELNTEQFVPGSEHRKWTEKALGNFELGRFGWVFENPVMFDQPIPYAGSQGFFSVDESLVLPADYRTRTGAMA